MNKKGFTLIELLVVIAIIGLLSTLAVVALGSARLKARDSKRLSDLKQTQTALELYYTDNSAYPTAASSTIIGTDTHACLNSAGFASTGCATPYMGQVPSDPGSGTYTYASADGITYTITATLEGTVSGLSGTVQATPSGIAGS
ncbi:MAG: prepilin-type N-terminal cleavage/methylation domain-containing protein [Candidatus Magasanikbacteria bacterium]